MKLQSYKSRFLSKKIIISLFLLLISFINTEAQTTQVVVYDIKNGDALTQGETVAPDLSSAGCVTASNISPYPLNLGYGANGGVIERGWLETLNLNKYFHFSITANSGIEIQKINFLTMSLTSDDLTYNAPNQGPEKFEIRASIDSFATFTFIQTISLVNFTYPRSAYDGTGGLPVNITDFSMLGSLNGVSNIEFRIYPYDIGGSYGNVRGGGICEESDVVISFDVTTPSRDTSLTISGSTITANEINVNYQWLDCNNNFSEIAGATNQTYNPPTNGNYAVSISPGCFSDTSRCVNITSLSIVEKNFDDNFQLYPNPTTDNITIDLGDTYTNIKATLTNSLGQIVLTKKIGSTDSINLDIDAPKGIYFLKLETASGETKTIKVLKE